MPVIDMGRDSLSLGRVYVALTTIPIPVDLCSVEGSGFIVQGTT